jgi:hypothetical protein
VALSFTSATGIDSATIPSHAAGDLIVAFAYRDGNNTRPALPSGQGWTELTSANGANSNSHTVAIKTAAGSSEATGTFTNATSFIVVVVKTDISGGLLGYKNGAPSGAQSSTLSFAGFTLDDPYSSSRVMLFAGHRSTNTTTDAAPADFTNITSVLDGTDEAAAHRSTNLLSTFNTITQSVGGTSSGWRTHTLEVYDYAVPNEQDLDITLDDVTVSASQTLQHSQALATTLDGITVAASQGLRHPQSLAITLDGIAVNVSQAIQAINDQALNITLDDINFASSQTLQHGQSLSATLDGIEFEAEQGVSSEEISQTVAFTLDGITFSATQVNSAIAPVVSSDSGVRGSQKPSRVFIERLGKTYSFADQRSALEWVKANPPVKTETKVTKPKKIYKAVSKDSIKPDNDNPIKLVSVDTSFKTLETPAITKAYKRVIKSKPKSYEEDDIEIILMCMNG